MIFFIINGFKTLPRNDLYWTNFIDLGAVSFEGCDQFSNTPFLAEQINIGAFHEHFLNLVGQKKV